MLTLREFQDSDAEKILQWVSDEKMFYRWSAGRFGEYPASPQAIITEYHAGKENHPDSYFPLVMVEGKDVLGSLLIRKPDNLSGNWRLGFIIVSPAVRGKGYGKKMILLALDYIRVKCQGTRVELGVFTENLSAIRCYYAAGFTEISGQTETYSMNGENWLCQEMEAFL